MVARTQDGGPPWYDSRTGKEIDPKRVEEGMQHAFAALPTAMGIRLLCQYALAKKWPTMTRCAVSAFLEEGLRDLGAELTHAILLELLMEVLERLEVRRVTTPVMRRCDGVGPIVWHDIRYPSRDVRCLTGVEPVAEKHKWWYLDMPAPPPDWQW